MFCYKNLIIEIQNRFFIILEYMDFRKIFRMKLKIMGSL